MKKYEVQIAGYGYGYEVEEGAIDIRFKDGAEITYSQVNHTLVPSVSWMPHASLVLTKY